ncbi:MAG TPA: hypothetical protein VN538_01715 [Clostridia bacterium]|nr:hypothetical protein [Clostridia bacterium]
MWQKTAIVYGILAAFCGVFSIVYLQFSHGESSPFLVWLFAPALLLGALPALLAGRTVVFKRSNAAARSVWNSAVATLICGMLVRAVINISGRYTDYDTIYWVLAGALFATAIALFAVRSVKQRDINRTVYGIEPERG